MNDDDDHWKDHPLWLIPASIIGMVIVFTFAVAYIVWWFPIMIIYGIEELMKKWRTK